MVFYSVLYFRTSGFKALKLCSSCSSCSSEALVLVIADLDSNNCLFQVPIRVHINEYNVSLHLQYAVTVADGLGRSLNTHEVLSKSLLKCCVCVSPITVNSSLNLPALLLLLLFCISSITVRFSLLLLEFLPLV